MARVAQFPARFDVLEDTSLASGCESDLSSIDLSDTRPAPLRGIAVPSAQNRPSRQVDSLAVEFRKLHIGEPHQLDQYKGRPVTSAGGRPRSGSRSTRPLNPFAGTLETVPEDENQILSRSAAAGVSARGQNYIELSAGRYSQHPLAIAARRLPSAEQQLTKHRSGDFEWVLTVAVPTSAACKDSDFARPGHTEPAAASKVFFGCNLFPGEAQPGASHDTSESPEAVYRLLVTPLQPTAELEAATEPNYKARNMEMAHAAGGDPAPMEAPEVQPGAQPEATAVNMSASSSTTSEDCDSLADMASRSPATTVARIEDSVDELDKLEEQLEAFNLAASPASLAAPRDKRPATPLAGSPPHNAHRTPHSTLQPRRVSLLGSPLDLKGSPSHRSPAYRSPRNRHSMVLLDSPKLKVEDKALAQAPPKRPANRGLASLKQPKPLAKSAKPPTIPAFELPGEAVARRLKEQRQARLSLIASGEEPQPPTPIRRTKSAKVPTRPNFELPGEAISRRKREEHEAKLRAQEEEERKRREFKARPVPTGRAALSSIPRETATSRARQGKPLLPENGAQSSTASKRSSLNTTRSPLSSASNQSRGRLVADDAAQGSRSTSSLNGSTSGMRSSVSLDDVQQQRRRGQEILRRDGLLAKDREREKREREALARLAREQAAERSRQLSREWAEKQKRKRMTIGSPGDVVAPSV